MFRILSTLTENKYEFPLIAVNCNLQVYVRQSSSEQITLVTKTIRLTYNFERLSRVI